MTHVDTVASYGQLQPSGFGQRSGSPPAAAAFEDEDGMTAIDLGPLGAPAQQHRVPLRGARLAGAQPQLDLAGASLRPRPDGF